MVKIPLNVLQFAKDTSPYEMFVDYWNHYSSFNGNKKAEFSLTRKDGSPISFAEKEAAMNEALKAEVARVSQVSFDSSIPLEQWANHPTVRWASFAVRNCPL